MAPSLKMKIVKVPRSCWNSLSMLPSWIDAESCSLDQCCTYVPRVVNVPKLKEATLIICRVSSVLYLKVSLGVSDSIQNESPRWQIEEHHSRRNRSKNFDFLDSVVFNTMLIILAFPAGEFTGSCAFATWNPAASSKPLKSFSWWRRPLSPSDWKRSPHIFMLSSISLVLGGSLCFDCLFRRCAMLTQVPSLTEI